MDIFFQEPGNAPVPPDEVRIRTLTAQPLPDGRRVAVRLEVTPFLKRPNLEVVLQDNQQETAAELSIVETMMYKMEFTMHIRRANTAGTYQLKARVLYPEEMPESPPPAEGEEVPYTPPTYREIDRSQIELTIP